jgi:hypothetical protein
LRRSGRRQRGNRRAFLLDDVGRISTKIPMPTIRNQQVVRSIRIAGSNT